jgi:hemolysin III
MRVRGDRLTFGKMQNPVRGILNGTAAVLSVAGGVVLWIRSAGDPSRQLALLVFALSLVALYAASSLYHSVPWRGVWKTRMQRVDHAMIYVLVAGTYTPIALVVLEGWPRWTAFGGTWGIALVGIAQKICRPAVGDWFSITMQTIQGWLALPLLGPLAQQLPWGALLQVMLGGVLYTLGMALFVTKRPRLWPRVFSYHEVFHVFVVAGSAVHYAVMFRYVAGFPGT